MTAAELIVELDRRGVELAADGDKLRYRPADAVDVELLAAIKEHKHSLLKWALFADSYQAHSPGPVTISVMVN